jgi:quercetin dioxygenase-like cupin family protein
MRWIVTDAEANFDNRVYDIVNPVVYIPGAEMENLIRRADARTTVTPNATMTTLASPTLGSTDGRSLWLAEMSAGATGPLHVFDSEQIWTVLDGPVSITVDGASHLLDAGDTLVIPGAAERQVQAVADCRMLVAGEGAAIASVAGEDAPRGTPAWIS